MPTCLAKAGALHDAALEPGDDAAAVAASTRAVRVAEGKVQGDAERKQRDVSPQAAAQHSPPLLDGAVGAADLDAQHPLCVARACSSCICRYAQWSIHISCSTGQSLRGRHYLYAI